MAMITVPRNSTTGASAVGAAVGEAAGAGSGGAGAQAVPAIPVNMKRKRAAHNF